MSTNTPISTNTFVYTTYIKSTPQKVWDAITTPEFTRQYWGDHCNISDWKKGSDWTHLDQQSKEVKIIGKVIESKPPSYLVLSWMSPSDTQDASRVTFEINPVADMVRLDITHDGFKPDSAMAPRVAGGWPLVLSSLKSILETGAAVDIRAIKTCGSADPLKKAG